MSQAKVDEYKKRKAVRKEMIARQKLIRKILQAVGCVIVIALVCLIGYKGYQAYEKSRPANTYYVNVDSMQEYISELNQ